jgi:hypothetical protein
MSIASRCMMVSLTVTKPQMTQTDREVSREVAEDKNASVAAVRVVKNLYPKHLIKPIEEIEAAARRYVDFVTGETSVRGVNLLPSLLFMPFQEKIGNYRLAFFQAVTVFMQNIADVMMQAEHEQGDMFDRSSYPDLSKLRSRFSFDVAYMPMTSTVLLDLEEKSLKELQATVEEQQKANAALAMAGVKERLTAAVKRIHTQCSKPDGKIYDTLTGNLKELLEVLPALNFVDDPEFAKLCGNAERLLVSPVAIKTVPGVRESTAATADEILKQMEGFL